jgi:serine/threonine protein kinase
MQNMARFYGSWTQGETRNILREYVGGGTLTDYFARTEAPKTEAEILEFWKNFIQLIKPIACIHRLPDPHDHHSYKVGYVQKHDFSLFLLRTDFSRLHNDIKPDNILVSEQLGSSPYSVSFKLADLGLAGFVVANESDETQLRDVHGTKMYSMSLQSFRLAQSNISSRCARILSRGGRPVQTTKH